jgi:hypothetical protein
MNVRRRNGHVIWLGVAVGVAAIALLLMIAVRRRRGAPDGRTIDDVDPLFTTGIALTGAGVALATTVGGFMYGVMIVGLILMAVGANRTRHPHH